MGAWVRRGRRNVRYERKLTLMRLISSALALKVVAALSAAEGLTLSGLARAAGASPTSVQRALGLLVDDDIVERAGKARPTYRLLSSERAATITTLALGEIPFAAAVTVGARANPSIEFVARERDSLVVVFGAASAALVQARAARFIDRLAARQGLAVVYLDHDDVRRELLADPGRRRRMSRAEILHGELDRAFPDRSRHGRRSGRALHGTHRSLRRPARSFLVRLARTHGLATVKLFGSAVRTDFRPDSDIDVLIRYRDGVRPSLRSLLDLERALEEAFGRDVDLVREEALRPEVRERTAREAVPLL